MGFKSVKSYNEERYNGLFILRNHGDYADVVFLYRNLEDVLIADTHYIKSSDYSGYVHCCGRGCPACSKNIRIQSKLFIPLYNLTTGSVEFWDRNIRFENQLSFDVFERCPDPSQFTFRIMRNGAAGDINTTYSIQLIGPANTTYDDILQKFNIRMPEYYSNICKEVSSDQLARMLANHGSSNSLGADSLPAYQVTPRPAAYSAEPAPSMIPPVRESIPTSNYNITAPLPGDTDLIDEDDSGDNVIF